MSQASPELEVAGQTSSPRQPMSRIVRCPLCSSPDLRQTFNLGHYAIARCLSCSFEFNASFIAGCNESGTFSQAYFIEKHADAFVPALEDFRKDESFKVYQTRLEQLEAQIAPGRVLDVGPGVGTFMRLARERGWEPHGVELSPFAANRIKQIHGLDVFTGDLQDYEGEAGSFDLVTFWDSIEHVVSPRQNLEKASRLLRQGGLLLLTTDNFDCLVAGLAKGLYRCSFGLVKYPVRRVFIDENMAYFTETSLRQLVMEAGFQECLFEKMEYPINKIRLNLLERLALSVIYGLAALTNRQAQMTLLAKKC